MNKTKSELLCEQIIVLLVLLAHLFAFMNFSPKAFYYSNSPIYNKTSFQESLNHYQEYVKCNNLSFRFN